MVGRRRASSKDALVRGPGTPGRRQPAWRRRILGRCNAAIKKHPQTLSVNLWITRRDRIDRAEGIDVVWTERTLTMMDRNTSGNEIGSFTAALLAETPALAFAVATYGPHGKVVRVVQARLPVSDEESLRRLLPWLKARNADGNAIWCRPAADDHPWIFLDDLPARHAHLITGKYAAVAVETSPGNAQAWICADRALTREERQTINRALAQRCGADPFAISEPRWGRAPGFWSGKAGRPWTALKAISIPERARFDPTPYYDIESAAALSRAPGPSAGLPPPTRPLRPRAGRKEGVDESAREFAYACHALRAGVPAETVAERVARHAYARGKRPSLDASFKYARRLVEAAAMA